MPPPRQSLSYRLGPASGTKGARPTLAVLFKSYTNSRPENQRLLRFFYTHRRYLHIRNALVQINMSLQIRGHFICTAAPMGWIWDLRRKLETALVALSPSTREYHLWVPTRHSSQSLEGGIFRVRHTATLGFRPDQSARMRLLQERLLNKSPLPTHVWNYSEVSLGYLESYRVSRGP